MGSCEDRKCGQNRVECYGNPMTGKPFATNGRDILQGSARKKVGERISMLRHASNSCVRFPRAIPRIIFAFQRQARELYSSEPRNTSAHRAFHDFPQYNRGVENKRGITEYRSVIDLSSLNATRFGSSSGGSKLISFDPTDTVALINNLS